MKLLAKWEWKLCTKEERLWKDVLGSWRSLDDRTINTLNSL